MAPSPSLPDPIESMLASLFGGPDQEFWPGVAKLCQQHPAEAGAIRRVAEQLQATARGMQAASTQGLAQGSGDTRDPNLGDCVGAIPRLAPESANAQALARRVQDLAERASLTARRYVMEGEIARGGMGAILRAFDKDLSRPLAMKVILGQTPGAQGDTPPVEPEVLARFLEEAQITGQLDHPGVVPVHELGLDSHGRTYFTMRPVQGQTAEDVFAFARAGQEGWTRTRALEVVLKVCDTLAYAHQKGVVHRDIKPRNVMVGKFGEVYVMDWGLAKVVGKHDRRDIRLRSESSISVRTNRKDLAADSPLLTMDGAVVGTPSFMPPEQAAGRVEEVGARADVYAVGALLYTLLAGRSPYERPGTRVSPHTILQWVIDGPPTPVHELDATVPAELVAICEKAMARKIGARYADTGELADDLRAYLEQRVVHAYRTGAWAELRAWTRRNKTLAMVLAVAVLGTSLGLGLAWLQARTAQRRTVEALAALSIPALVVQGAGGLTDPPPGTLRYRTPSNKSVFGATSSRPTTGDQRRGSSSYSGNGAPGRSSRSEHSST